MDRAIETFRARLNAVQGMWEKSHDALIANPEISGIASRISDFIKESHVSEDLPSVSGSSRFEIHEVDKSFRFAVRFRGEWESYLHGNTSGDFEKHAIYDLFLLHEAVHPLQLITGIRHSDAGSAPSIISALDYEADAFAVLALHILYKQCAEYDVILGADRTLGHELAWNIDMLIKHMQVFNYQKTPEHKYEIVEGLSYARFQRYLQWHYNYSRARRYRGEESDGLRLMRQPLLDIVFGAVPASMTKAGFSELDNSEKWPMSDRVPEGKTESQFKRLKRWLDQPTEPNERNHSTGRLLLVIRDEKQTFQTYRRDISVPVLHEYMSSVVRGEIGPSTENFFRDLLHNDHPELLEPFRDRQLEVLNDLGIDLSDHWASVARLHPGRSRCEVLTAFCERASWSLMTTRYSKRPIGTTEESKQFEAALDAAISRLGKTGVVQRIVCVNHHKKTEHIKRLYEKHNGNRALALYWTTDANPFELFILDDELAVVGLTFPGIDNEHVDDWWIEIRNQNTVKTLKIYYEAVLRPSEEKCLKQVNGRFRENWKELIEKINIEE